MTAKTKVGLLLGGGGARAAYQVGVLKAISEILPDQGRNPFPIICGTSAGGINAAVLASYANRFKLGVERLVGVWQHFRVEKVFRADALSALSRSTRWLAAVVTGGLETSPKSILDVSPLRTLLESHVSFERIEQCIDHDQLTALCVTASSYTSGRSVSFYRGRQELEAWTRARRHGVATRMGIDHLMATAAIPILFPAVRIGREFYGDGSMRQTAPISPCLHLGAEKVLIIGVRRENPPEDASDEGPDYPGVGQIAGYILDTLFLNSLSADLERLERINRTLNLVEDKKKTGLREIETLMISPSEDIAALAEPFYHHFPASVRYLLSVIGARRGNGRRLMSYLMFEEPYCQNLIDLGYRDTVSRTDDIVRFMGV